MMAAKTTPDAVKQIHYLAAALKAPRITEAAQRLADQARDAGWTHEDYLAAVLEREVSARNASGAEARIRSAGFPARKTLEDFDFDAQPPIRNQIAALASGAFLTRGRQHRAARPSRHRQDPSRDRVASRAWLLYAEPQKPTRCSMHQRRKPHMSTHSVLCPEDVSGTLGRLIARVTILVVQAVPEPLQGRYPLSERVQLGLGPLQCGTVHRLPPFFRVSQARFTCRGEDCTWGVDLPGRGVASALGGASSGPCR